MNASRAIAIGFIVVLVLALGYGVAAVLGLGAALVFTPLTLLVAFGVMYYTGGGGGGGSGQYTRRSKGARGGER